MGQGPGVPDRRSLSPAERAARRERVRRRAAERAGSGVIELGPPGHRYRIHDPGGGGRVAKILRTGTPYEAGVLADMAALGAVGTAVDVGANIGNHSLWMAVVCRLRVEAFEPAPVNLERLYANVTLNDLQGRVAVHPAALASASSVATPLDKGRLRVGVGEVPVRTLDSYGLTDVSLLKIDVEGMEAEVIRGGLDIIARDRPTIYAEAWDDDYRAKVGALLQPLGYRLGRRLKWHQQRWDPQ